MRHLIIILISIFISQIVYAQIGAVLTLEDCVDQALEKNLDLKIQKNYEKNAMYNRQQSQWQFAPSINGYGNTGINFRRSTNQNNDISAGTSYNMNYGVSASLTLFSGLTRLNTIAATKFNELAYLEGTQYSANMLYLQILEQYAISLYHKAMIGVAQERFELSLKEKERIAAFIEQGQTEPAAIHEISAIASGNKVSKNRMESNYKLSLLQLSQLIEWNETNEFSIATNQFNLINPTDKAYTFELVYEMACERLPQIKRREYQLEYYQKMLAVAKGNMAPNLSMNGGYSSGFYSTDTLANGSPTAFNDQFDKYLNPNLGISLRVPIFNGLRKSLDIKRAKIDIENAVYQLENEKKQIKKEILEAIQRLEAYHLEYQSALENLTFVLKSFETYQEKYRLGIINTTDFITAQNQLSQARVDVIGAKYNWIVQDKIIQLYMGASTGSTTGPIN